MLTSRVITEDNDIEKRDLDKIGSEFDGEFPCRSKSLQSAALYDSLSNLVKRLRRGIESLKVLLSSTDALCEVDRARDMYVRLGHTAAKAE